MKLGSKQKSVLSAMCYHRTWYVGCGWLWDTLSGTEKVMRSLAKKGLVDEKTCDHRWSKGVMWEINEEGEKFNAENT